MKFFAVSATLISLALPTAISWTTVLTSTFRSPSFLHSTTVKDAAIEKVAAAPDTGAREYGVVNTSKLSKLYDLVVIGGGPGGYASAFYAASAGMKVALIERDTIGGTCLNRGCIPAKAFLETAAANRHVAHASEFGIQATSAGVDFAVSQARKARIVDGLVKGLTGLTK